MTRRRPGPAAPGPLGEYAARFDDLLGRLAQRRGFREYLAGLWEPRDRNKTLIALAGGGAGGQKRQTGTFPATRTEDASRLAARTPSPRAGSARSGSRRTPGATYRRSSWAWPSPGTGSRSGSGPGREHRRFWPHPPGQGRHARMSAVEDHLGRRPRLQLEGEPARLIPMTFQVEVINKLPLAGQCPTSWISSRLANIPVNCVLSLNLLSMADQS